MLFEMDEFLRSIEISKGDSFSFLLGAGASISSGVQSASDCIWEWKKDIYVSKNPHARDWIENYKMQQVRETIQKWLDSEGYYPPMGDETEYSFYVEKCYKIEDDRRKYFQRICNNKQPALGYKLLCLLYEVGMLKSVWTTNFDNLTIKAANQSNIQVIDITLDSIARLNRTQNNMELLHISLHGDYRYGPLKNTTEELQFQEQQFKEKLIEYLTDKHLVVLGYSGRDKSLMSALKEVYGRKGTGRLYWCGYGREINSSVAELLKFVKNNGRTAVYVPTDGFDDTLLRISKLLIRDSKELLQKFHEIIKVHDIPNDKTPFSINISHINTIIKSNSFPVEFPKEVFQFQIKERDEMWAYIREKTEKSNIVAVPFKRNIWAFGTLTELYECFGKDIVGSIQRKPINVINIQKETALSHLLLSTLTISIASNSSLMSNKKNLIWTSEDQSTKTVKGEKFRVYKAIRVSLQDNTNGEYFITISPDVYIAPENQSFVEKEIKQIIGKEFFEKIWNNQFNEYLNKWRNLVFGSNSLSLEFPLNSGTGFIFKVNKNPFFAEIMEAGSTKGVSLSTKFNTRLIKYSGIKYSEPYLLFSPQFNDMHNVPRDFHPMRGLCNNKPFDFKLSGDVLSNQINLGVICPQKDASMLYEFLNKQNSYIKTNNSKDDYLIDYPGFYNVYGVTLNIPEPSTDNWINCSEPAKSFDQLQTCLELGRKIREHLEYVAREKKSMVVVIYIPERWEPYLRFNNGIEEYDLHDYIKAFCAEIGITTQFLQEKTLKNYLQCQIHWWLSLSFYVKSFRTPWVLYGLDKNTAYAGIGYSLNHNKVGNPIILGCSHIYNSQGLGLKYKLSKVEDQIFWDNQKNPHLSYEDAYRFGVSIKELFYQSMNELPKRVVVHKRTYFTRNEINGIRDSLIGRNEIENIDLIEINLEDNVKYVASKINSDGMPNEADNFSVARGTCVLTGTNSALIWAHGVVQSVRNPYYKYFMGGRYIPAPLKVKKHFGQSNIGQIATEILGLSKMNWNNLNLYSQLPATIKSSNDIARIGKLLTKREGTTYDYRYFI